MKKLLSLILAVCLVFTALPLGYSLVSAESTLEEIVTTYHLSSYNAIVNLNSNISEIKEVSIQNKGIENSYGLVIEGNGKYTSTYLRFDENYGTKFLKSDKTYTMQLSARADGTVSYINYGARMHGNYFSTKVDGNDITGEWQTYTYEFTPTCTANDYWVHMYLNYNVAVGSTLYIDNIVVFESDDTSKTNLFIKGDFDGPSHYEGEVTESDGTSGVYTPNELSNYAPSWTNTTDGNITNSSAVEIAENIGFNYSCALKFGTGTYNAFMKFASQNISENAYFKAGETYRIGFKAKKYGTIADFCLKLKQNSAWSGYTLFSAEIDDDWKYYAFDLVFDEFGITGSQNKNLGFAATVGDHSYLLIDDIEIYNIKDTTKTNQYTLGSFDSFNSNLDYGYSPYDISIYRVTDTVDGVVQWNSWDNKSGVEDSDMVKIAAGGKDGTYALKITGDGSAHEIALNMGVNKLEVSTEYTVNFDARITNPDGINAFTVGLMKRWSWKDAQTAFSISDTNEIGTDWKTYSGKATTAENYQGAYHFVHIGFNIPVGSTLLIDNISVKSADGTEYFYKGTFERKIEKWNKLSDQAADVLFRPNYINDYTTNKDGFNAEVISIDNAKSGNNVLAMGFNPTAMNGRVNFQTAHVRPGGTYKFEAYVLFVGDVKESVFSFGDNDPILAEGETSEHIPESSTVFKFSSLDTYYPRTWMKIEETFTDLTTSTDNSSYRWSTFNISFRGNANSGMLVDSISITPVSEYIDGSPNIFTSGGFELEELPDVTWSDTYFGENVDDLSFMNSLPKTMGELGNSLKTDYKIYSDLIDKNGDFSYLNMVVLDVATPELAAYETQKALENGKEIWLGATYIVSYGISGENGAVYDDWQTRLDRIAYVVQSVAGDKFQGVYFDEPHLKFRNNDEFVMVTKYIRENYKKRVFSMAKHDMFNLEGSANVTITAESHRYVTDLGYWNYSISGMETRSKKFNEAAARLSPDVRKWICCLMGKTASVTTEEDNITMFTHMLNAAKTNNNFGGILLWDAYDTGGYNVLKPDQNGVIEYDNYRALLKAASEDLVSPYSWLNKNHTVTKDGYIAVDKENLTVGTFKSTFSPSLLSYIKISLQSSDAPDSYSLLNSDIKLTVSGVAHTEAKELKIVMAGDVNGDGDFNAIDIVKAKKISAGSVTGVAENYASAGTSISEGITALNITGLRNKILIK